VISIEELKETVTVEEVLAYYGADVGVRWTSWNAWAPINCPFCRDTNGSGSMNRGAGYYLCHQCSEPRDGQAGDIIDIVKSQENLDTKAAIQWISTQFTK
jgi:hypothetical protein